MNFWNRKLAGGLGERMLDWQKGVDMSEESLIFWCRYRLLHKKYTVEKMGDCAGKKEK